LIIVRPLERDPLILMSGMSRDVSPLSLSVIKRLSIDSIPLQEITKYI